MNQLIGRAQQQYNQAQSNPPPHMIYVNIVVTLKQSNINMQVQIDPEIPFNIFINGIKEQIFTKRKQSDYEEKIEYQLGIGGQINEFDSRSLRQLGFTSDCTFYVKLTLKKSTNYSDFNLNKVFLGVELLQQQRYEEAIKFYDQAIQFNKQNPEFYFGKGKALLALNRER